MRKAAVLALLTPVFVLAGVIGAPGDHSGHGPVINTSLLPARQPGFVEPRVRMARKVAVETPTLQTTGSFRIFCGFSHMGFIDPIVYPGQRDKSHLHAFFGNSDTDEKTTAESIHGGSASTCVGGTVNRSAYWVPSVIDTAFGAPVAPAKALIYYKTGYNGVRPEHITLMPAGLRMIAGDAKNAAPRGAYEFKCIGDGVEQMASKSIPDCPAGSELWAEVAFPQCWNGVDLDSADHKSHMSYTRPRPDLPDGFTQYKDKRWCPETHPYPVPEIRIIAIYDVKASTASWRLASDMYDASLPAGYSMHADWFNGWNQADLDTFTVLCLRASKDCHANVLGDGRVLF